MGRRLAGAGFARHLSNHGEAGIGQVFDDGCWREELGVHRHVVTIGARYLARAFTHLEADQGVSAGSKDPEELCKYAGEIEGCSRVIRPAPQPASTTDRTFPSIT